jgi:hypothetical protein
LACIMIPVYCPTEKQSRVKRWTFLGNAAHPLWVHGCPI